MTEPVKLSRERWEMLADSFDGTLPGFHRTMNCLPLTQAREIDGITFLPATYVPDEHPSGERLIECGRRILDHRASIRA